MLITPNSLRVHWYDNGIVHDVTFIVVSAISLLLGHHTQLSTVVFFSINLTLL